jgi:3,8-divinyl chlorophyllide a/chlorophyllide a reductase subunit X
MTLDIPNLKDFDQRLRDEAHEEPTLEVPQSEPTKKTQIIAIYGKGGIGKSFTLANLSHMMAEMGKRVLLIGCDPKSDTTSLLFGGKACPTIIETSTRKKLAGEEVKIGDVCFKRGGVFAMELGGPEVGRGCGGRGIIHGFELLEKLGFHDWDFDYVLLDFLGDVVCGGFGLPIARDMAQKVIIVASNDLQSLYVANNVCSAVEYFRKLGGNVGVAGLVINKDDGTGEAAAFAKAVDIPDPRLDPAGRRPAQEIRELPDRRHRAEPVGRHVRRPRRCRGHRAAAPARAADQDGLLGLFDSKQTGGDFVLVPATDMDMRGKNAAPKKSLEVVYDDV